MPWVGGGQVDLLLGAAERRRRRAGDRLPIRRRARTCRRPACPTHWRRCSPSARAAASPSARAATAACRRFHAPAWSRCRISRAGFASGHAISHHISSPSDAEKPIVVPWRFSRARMICSASSSRASRSGASGMRLRMSHQSSTADVGHRFGSIAMLSEQRRLRLPGAGERGDGGELANGEVGGAHRGRAEDRAGDEACAAHPPCPGAPRRAEPGRPRWSPTAHRRSGSRCPTPSTGSTSASRRASSV